MNNDSDLKEILSQAIETIKSEQGDNFDIKNVKVSQMQRLTGLSRKKLRNLKKNDFQMMTHGGKHKRPERSVMHGFEAVVDDMLKNGITNSEVILSRITDLGYTGSLTSIKRYIEAHKDLIPSKRTMVAPQGNRGRRYSTGPGESYQMDWGFVNVNTADGGTYQVSCFALICHHCGMRYIEFFTNARQENLFIGMIHAFEYMGVPTNVLTDNMKSVVNYRDAEGKPVWNKEYEVFMNTVGFKTKLCKPRHPFTKGAVERLVRFVKQNFIVGRTFSNITDLNCESLKWCNQQNERYHQAVDCIPAEIHLNKCMLVASILNMTKEAYKYLCPVRKITFDGFVSYENRRFGVPYWYKSRTCRVERKDFYLHIYDNELNQQIAVHNVTWSRKDSFVADQYNLVQPEEFPTAPVRAILTQKPEQEIPIGFDKFDFGKKVDWDV